MSDFVHYQSFKCIEFRWDLLALPMTRQAAAIAPIPRNGPFISDCLWWWEWGGEVCAGFCKRLCPRLRKLSPVRPRCFAELSVCDYVGPPFGVRGKDAFRDRCSQLLSSSLPFPENTSLNVMQVLINVNILWYRELDDPMLYLGHLMKVI